MPKKALMLCHKTLTDGGTLADVLRARDDFTLDCYMAYDDPLQNIDPQEHDLTIFMGGAMGVYNRDIFPFLETEISYLKARLATKKPYLGVCLGAQLMATALGGDVSAGKQGKEVGWHSIQVNEAGLKTPLKYFDQSQTDMLQWHGDTFTMPEGCTLLASSETYKHQAIQYGDKALGVQFHPEVNKAILEMWTVFGFDTLLDLGINPHEFRQSFSKKLPVLKAQTEKFFNAWLDEVMV
jgi:GMP synthase (glutamine-hydrolysing)